MLFIKLTSGWWELDKETHAVYNYNGGHHYIDDDVIDNHETFEGKNWHSLYEAKHYCPIETTHRSCHVWISPDGKFYEAEAHDVSAENLCEIIYGTEPMYPGDELEKRGWIRATTNAMWKVRLDTYWKDKTLTQKQQDALWDWCKRHYLEYPYKR